MLVEGEDSLPTKCPMNTPILKFGRTIIYWLPWHHHYLCRVADTRIAMHKANVNYNTTRSKKFSPKNKKDLGMAYHTPPLKKAKKQGEMPLPSLGPIPLKKI